MKTNKIKLFLFFNIVRLINVNSMDKYNIRLPNDNSTHIYHVVNTYKNDNIKRPFEEGLIASKEQKIKEEELKLEKMKETMNETFAGLKTEPIIIKMPKLEMIKISKLKMKEIPKFDELKSEFSEFKNLNKSDEASCQLI